MANNLPIDSVFSEEAMKTFFISGVKVSQNSFNTTYHSDLDQYYMDWRDLKRTEDHQYVKEPNFSSPITSTSVDNIVPRLVDDLIGFNEPIDVQAITDNDLVDVIETGGRKLMNWDVNSHEELKSELWHGVQNACWAGNAFAYTYFLEEKDFDEREIEIYRINDNILVGISIQPDEAGNPVPIVEALPEKELNKAKVAPMEVNAQNDQIIMQLGLDVTLDKIKEKTEKLKKYEPNTIIIPNKRVYWSIDAESMEDAYETGFVAIEVHKTLDQMFRMLRSGNEAKDKALFKKLSPILKKNRESFKESANPDSNTNNVFGNNLYVDQIDVNQVDLKGWKLKKMKFHIIFGRYDIDNDYIDEQVVMWVHVASNTMLTWEPSPYDHKMCPVTNLFIHPIHGKVEGIGIPEKLFDIKGMIDKERNQRFKNRDLHNEPRVLVRNLIGFDSVIHNGSNNVWELDDISQNSIRFEKINPIDSNSYKEEDILKTEAQSRMGLSNTAMGLEADTEQTFRGLLQLLEEGTKSRGMFKKWLAVGFQKIFYMRYRLYKQFWGRDARDNPQVQEYINLILKQNQKIGLSLETLDVLDHDLNVILTATTDDQRSRLIKAESEYKVLKQNNLVVTSPEYNRKADVDMLKAMGIADPDSKIPPLEVYQQEQVAIQKQAMAELQAEQEEARQQRINEEEKNKELGVLEYINGRRGTPQSVVEAQMAQAQGV